MTEAIIKRMKRVLDVAMEIVIFYDENYRILGNNQFAEKELAYSGEELRVMTLDMIFESPEEDAEGIEEKFLQKDEDKNIQLTAYRRNKTCFPVELKCSEVVENEEHFYVLFANNISARQEQERKYQKQKEKAGAADRLRQEFTSNVTHELRTPINGIKGHAQILAETELDKNQKQRVDTILRACTDMESLVNSILDYAKLEAGKFDLESKPFNFREFMAHVEAVNRITIENKGLDFLVMVGDTIPEEVVGDSLRLTQILNNLISNARKFTASGQITVEASMTKRTESEVEIFFMVVDTGIGISKNDMDKLFQPFSQVDASIARQYGGTGLGLAICKQLVENMGGNIQVSSAKGEGSNFSFNVILGNKKKFEEEQAEKNDFIMEAASEVEEKKPEVRKLKFADQEEMETEEVMIFGSEINKREVRNHLIRIIICLEMERFDKAEEYLDAVKGFMKNGPEEVTKLLFRMGMQVRKENYDKSFAYYEQLKELLDSVWEEG